MKNDTLAPRPLTTRWQRVVVVCRQCQKRGSGPDDLKAKALSKALRAAGKHAPGGPPRVVLVSCLGLCPRGAIAVSVPDAEGAMRCYAIDDAAQVAALFPGRAGTV